MNTSQFTDLSITTDLQNNNYKIDVNFKVDNAGYGFCLNSPFDPKALKYKPDFEDITLLTDVTDPESLALVHKINDAILSTTDFEYSTDLFVAIIKKLIK